jgi:hypothetical protein
MTARDTGRRCSTPSIVKAVTVVAHCRARHRTIGLRKFLDRIDAGFDITC